MGKLSTVKFIGNYLIALLAGNFIVYEIDKIGVRYGQIPMSSGKYIFVNAVAILIGIFIYTATSKTKK